MTEPLDPVTAGVVAVLQGIRKRAGLTEDRLVGYDLDTLAGLGRVGELVAAGTRPQEAVIQAVREAAAALEPTHSIVADASLGLGLAADLAPDLELYPPDLGRRREVLLANWGRLHELRAGAPAGPVPSMRTLRLELETDAFSALASALTDGRRSRTGPGGPAGPTGERTAPGEDAPERLPLVRSQVPLLLEEFRRIAAALRAALRSDDPGWPHDLRPESKPVTALSTSFGIQAMLLLEGTLAPDLVPAARQLRKRASSGGGYKARAQLEPRPEVTAAVLGTLHRVEGTADFGTQLAAMKQALEPFDKTRPFILTCVLETSVQLGIDPRLTRSLIRDLLDARRPYGGVLLWPEKAEPGLAGPEASVAHTARAVRALARAMAAPSAGPPSGEVREAVDQAAAWLAGVTDLGNAYEIIDRQFGDRVEQVYIRHFTPAWVVRALVSAGLPASHPSVASAVAHVWADYNYDAALWGWSNGDLPVWMTMDAVDALQSAGLATTIRPAGSGVP